MPSTVRPSPAGARHPALHVLFGRHAPLPRICPRTDTRPSSDTSPDGPTVAAEGRRAPPRPGQPFLSAPRASHPLEVCRLYNANMCRYARCRHAHVCAHCHLPHPVSECDRAREDNHGHPRTPLPPPRTWGGPQLNYSSLRCKLGA